MIKRTQIYTMNKLLTVALLAVIISTVSCQETSKGSLLIADYKIRYTVASSELELKAKYKTLLPKVSEEAFLPVDGVDVFDKPMDYKSMQGHADDYYSFKDRVPFEETIKFRFKNEQKQLIEQTVEFQPLKNISIDRETIQKDNGFNLVWEGDSLSKKDELRIIFDYDTKQPVRMNLVGGSSGNKLFIRKEQIANLTAGKVKIAVVQRRYEKYPEGSAVLGSYVVEYYHAPIYVEVE